MQISEIFSKKLSILAGAGVSAGFPSNLPTAITILKGLFNELSRYGSGDDSFNTFVEELSRGNERLRFEAIISKVQNYFDHHLKILDCFDFSDSPNYLHYFLAHMAKRGDIVITTNFDILIEIALKEMGCGDFRQAVEDDNFFIERNQVKVFKIHGSMKRYQGNTFIDSKETICASLESVGRLGLAFQLSPKKRDVFSNVLQKYDLLVIGYSGSDDFDISPLLESIPSDKNLIWLEHSFQNKEPIIYNGEQLFELESSSTNRILINNLIKRGMRKPENVFLIEAETSQFIKRYSQFFHFDWEQPPNPHNTFHFNAEEYFSNWISAISLNEGHIVFLKGILFKLILEEKKANEAFEVAIDYFERGGDNQGVSTGIHELCTTTNLLEDLDRFEHLAMKAEAIDRLERPDWHPLSLNLLAVIYEKKNELEKSIQFYQRAISEAMENEYYCEAAFCLSCLSNLLRSIGKFKLAKKKLLMAAEIFEEIGLLEELSKARRGLAICCMEMNEFAESEIFLEEAIIIYRKLFNWPGVSNVLHEKGILLRITRRFFEAKKTFLEVLKITRKYDHKLSLSLSLKELALTEVCLGNLKDARLLEAQSSDLLISLQNYYFYAHNVQLQGIIEEKAGNKDIAKSKYLESIEISRKYNDQKNIANCEALLRLLSEMR